MSRADRHKSGGEKVYINRLLFIQGAFFLVLLGLIGRLFYIQIVKGDFYIGEVMKQRQLSIPVDSGRGLILDRNFIPLTDREEKQVAVVFPQHFILNESNVAVVQEITDVPYEELFNRIQNAKHMLEFPVEKELNWADSRLVNTKGLFIVNKKVRYEEDGLLTHVIGYINQVDLRGMFGVEGAMDGVLASNSSRALIATLDGRKRFIPGEGYAVSSRKTKMENVRLTVDYHIQKILEDTIDESKKQGSVIVSDIHTGEILGMVSRPNFNPNKISEHLKSQGDELYNKAIQLAFPPGSIFKIVVAIEALRQNPEYEHQLFYCEGYETVGEVEIKCASFKKGGHGEITLERAFAESCNSAFIQLAREIGSKNIMNTAKELGLGDIVNIGLLEEKVGNLPEGDNLLGPAYGNIAIGQGQILSTPLQINQLTQIIGNGGLKKNLYLMEDIVDKNYNLLKKSNKVAEKQVMDEEIIEKVQHWMEKVMTEGSGRQVGELSNITAGKTGSAESIENGLERVHAWFTGYYPSESPKYAVTVFVQNGGSGGSVAVPIFGKIVERMINLGYK